MKKREAGQGLVEYALILVLVAVVVIAILMLLGPQIGNTFCSPWEVGDIILCVVTQPDYVYTPPDTERLIDVAYNDGVPGTGSSSVVSRSSVSLVENPEHGSVVNNGDGTFTYEPDSGFTGIDTFVYRIAAERDGVIGQFLNGHVKIGVGVLVDAADDSISFTSYSGTNIYVHGNDFILNGENDHPRDPTQVEFTIEYTDPRHGRLEYYDYRQKRFYYFVDPGYSGPDDFEYTICNLDDVCDVAQVNITVIGDMSTDSSSTNTTAIAASSSEPLASVGVESNSLLEWQRNLLLTQENSWDDLDLQPLLNLYDEATNQDAAFNLAGGPIKEILHEVINVLLASEDLSEETKESLPGIEQDFNSGDIESVYSAMEELILIVEETPAIEFDQVIPATRYHWLAACEALVGAEVTSYEAALETLYLMEETDPGSTGDAIPELEGIGVNIEFRNAAVGYSANVCALISDALLDFDDLYQVIADAVIDDEGVRQSFHDQASEAADAFYDENLRGSGNTLCALLRHLEAQDGKHVDSASAEDIRNMATAVAAQLGIPLSCDQ